MKQTIEIGDIVEDEQGRRDVVRWVGQIPGVPDGNKNSIWSIWGKEKWNGKILPISEPNGQLAYWDAKFLKIITRKTRDWDE